MKKILLILLLVLLVVVGILVFNTFQLSSKQVAPLSVENVELPDDIYQNLSKGLQYKTISYSEDAIPDSTAFFGFHQFLEETFPRVHEKLYLEKINTYSLLYTWQGSDLSKKPLILMSHQDVVL
ncbi:hypothetical protein NYZ99_00475 [Maribacter litopenaei]|uniref:Peptidase M20 n=1 Tax=Maribacter litopenaei TaxID=2976127 RepID=A0ABY5Y807_9FLAO|nr:hypothetical protein [Maribacter litopenaei]UWX55152.1 hypothetical protein NYZ99_00475 [Maribacter litopenaei]